MANGGKAYVGRVPYLTMGPPLQSQQAQMEPPMLLGGALGETPRFREWEFEDLPKPESLTWRDFPGPTQEAKKASYTKWFPKYQDLFKAEEMFAGQVPMPEPTKEDLFQAWLLNTPQSPMAGVPMSSQDQLRLLREFGGNLDAYKADLKRRYQQSPELFKTLKALGQNIKLGMSGALPFINQERYLSQIPMYERQALLRVSKDLPLLVDISQFSGGVLPYMVGAGWVKALASRVGFFRWLANLLPAAKYIPKGPVIGGILETAPSIGTRAARLAMYAAEEGLPLGAYQAILGVSRKEEASKIFNDALHAAGIGMLLPPVGKAGGFVRARLPAGARPLVVPLQGAMEGAVISAAAMMPEVVSGKMTVREYLEGIGAGTVSGVLFRTVFTGLMGGFRRYPPPEVSFEAERGKRLPPVPSEELSRPGLERPPVVAPRRGAFLSEATRTPPPGRGEETRPALLPQPGPRGIPQPTGDIVARVLRARGLPPREGLAPPPTQALMRPPEVQSGMAQPPVSLPPPPSRLLRPGVTIEQLAERAMPRKEIQARGYRNVVKSTDLFGEGYSISHWFHPGTKDIIFEYNPRSVPGVPVRPRLTAHGPEEQQLVHQALGLPFKAGHTLDELGGARPVPELPPPVAPRIPIEEPRRALPPVTRQEESPLGTRAPEKIKKLVPKRPAPSAEPAAPLPQRKLKGPITGSKRAPSGPEKSKKLVTAPAEGVTPKKAGPLTAAETAASIKEGGKRKHFAFSTYEIPVREGKKASIPGWAGYGMIVHEADVGAAARAGATMKGPYAVSHGKTGVVLSGNIPTLSKAMAFAYRMSRIVPPRASRKSLIETMGEIGITKEFVDVLAENPYAPLPAQFARVSEPEFERVPIRRERPPTAPGTKGWAIETVVQPAVFQRDLARFRRRGASDEEIYRVLRSSGGVDGWFMTYAPGKGSQPGYAVDWDFSGEPRMWITKHPFTGDPNRLIGPLRKGKPTLEGRKLAQAFRDHFGIQFRFSPEERARRKMLERQRGFASNMFWKEGSQIPSLEEIRNIGEVAWENMQLFMRAVPQTARGLGALVPDWFGKEMAEDPDMPQGILRDIFTRQPIREPMPNVDTGARGFWLLAQLPRGPKGDIGGPEGEIGLWEFLKQVAAGLYLDPEAQFTEHVVRPHQNALRKSDNWMKGYSRALYDPRTGVLSRLRKEFGKDSETHKESRRRIFTALEYEAIKARYGEEYLKRKRYVHPSDLTTLEKEVYRRARSIWNAFRKRFDEHYPKPTTKQGLDETGKPNDRDMWGLWDYVTHVFDIETEFRDPHVKGKGISAMARQMQDPLNIPRKRFFLFEQERKWQEGYVQDIEVALNRYIPGAVMKLTMEEAWSEMKPRIFGKPMVKRNSYTIGKDIDRGIILPGSEQRGSSVLVRFTNPPEEGKKRPTRGPWRVMRVHRWDPDSRTLYLRDDKGKVHQIDPRRVDPAPEGDPSYRAKYPKVYIAYKDKGLIQFLARKEWPARMRALERWLRDITQPRRMSALSSVTQKAASFLYEAHLGRMAIRPAMTNFFQNLLTIQDIGLTTWMQAWQALTVGLPEYGVQKGPPLKGRLAGKEIPVPINSFAVAIVRKALGKDFSWGILTEAAHLAQTSKDFRLDPSSASLWTKTTKPARDTMMLLWRASEGLNRVLATLGGYIDAMKRGGLEKKYALERKEALRQAGIVESELEELKIQLEERRTKTLESKIGVLERKLAALNEKARKAQMQAYEDAVEWGRLVVRRTQGLYDRHASPEYFRTHYDDNAFWQAVKIAIRQYQRYPTVFSGLQFGYARDFWLKAVGEAGPKRIAGATGAGKPPLPPSGVPMVSAFEEIPGFGDRIPLPPPGSREWKGADMETRTEWLEQWRALAKGAQRKIERFYRRLRRWQDDFEAVRSREAWRGRDPRRIIRGILITLAAIYAGKQLGLDWGLGVVIEFPLRFADLLRESAAKGWQGAAEALMPVLVRIAIDAQRILTTAWKHRDATEGNLPTYYAWVDQTWNLLGNNVLGGQTKKLIDTEVFSKELPQWHPRWTPEEPVGVWGPSKWFHPGMEMPRYMTSREAQWKSILFPGRALEREEHQKAIKEIEEIFEKTIMARETIERAIMDWYWHVSRGNAKEALLLAQGIDAAQKATGEYLSPEAVSQRVEAGMHSRLYNRILTGTVTQRARNLLAVLRRRQDTPSLMAWQEVIAALQQIYGSNRSVLIPREVTQELEKLLSSQTPK